MRGVDLLFQRVGPFRYTVARPPYRPGPMRKYMAVILVWWLVAAANCSAASLLSPSWFHPVRDSIPALVVSWLIAHGVALAQDSTPDDSPSPSPTASPAATPALSADGSAEVPLLIDIRYCLLYLIGVQLCAMGYMAWGRWHKG